MRKVLIAACWVVMPAVWSTETLPLPIVPADEGLHVRANVGGVEVSLPVALAGVSAVPGKEKEVQKAIANSLKTHLQVVLWNIGELPVTDERGLSAIVLLGTASAGFSVNDKIRDLESVQEVLITQGLVTYSGFFSETFPELDQRWKTCQADAHPQAK